MNSNPEIHETKIPEANLVFSNGKLTNTNQSTIFELLRNIKDPEHPYSLEQLNVVKIDYIKLESLKEQKDCFYTCGLDLEVVEITFEPTVPHCSMAGIIGLAIIYQLNRYLKKEMWIKVKIKEDTHVNYKALNKQLQDEDRVRAALENEAMLKLIMGLVPDMN